MKSTRIFLFLSILLSMYLFHQRKCTALLATPLEQHMHRANPIEWHRSVYYDTTFLSDYDRVKQEMLLDGFQEGFFKTSDGFAINYLFLKRPRAHCTVIFCCGWFPGRKEGLATFYAMLPPYCNLLFFDARGHGLSDGSLLAGVYSYGQHEYKDIIAAIRFAHAQHDAPIILFGTCAGAFNAAHALIKLTHKKEIDRLRVTGLIFDSGWGSVAASSFSAPYAKIQETINQLINGSRKNNTPATRFLAAPFLALYTTLHTFSLRPLIALNEHKTTLFDKISTLTVPTLFIHSYDDDFVSIKNAKKLAKKVPTKQCWWISQPSKHACHHLKHPHRYREQIIGFLESLVTPA